MNIYLKKEIIDEIERVVKYLWHDEEKNWHECEIKERDNHIFNSLCKINNALNLKIEIDEDFIE